jgi:hypothetical protein
VGKKMSEEETKEMEMIKKLRQIPNLKIYKDGEIYEIRKITEYKDIKLLLEIEFIETDQETENESIFPINYILTQVYAKELYITLIEYDDSNYYFYVSSNKMKFEKNVENDYGEYYYFKEIEDIYSTFSDMLSFIRERIENVLYYHNNEIPFEIKNKIQNLLIQL